ncbi:hypothetical protein SEVCU012_1109 [Staphylococcus pettenkoferi VCU012]|nr:hypothetical protein SEVCU012_1109 [Staphylococcus pettenkoferi VCU012]
MHLSSTSKGIGWFTGSKRRCVIFLFPKMRNAFTAPTG